MPNGIAPTIKMSMELTKVLADIEMNGLHINTNTLTSIKTKFEKKLVIINQKYIAKQIFTQGSFNHNQLLFLTEKKIKKNDAPTAIISAIELLKIKTKGIKQIHHEIILEIIKK